MPDIFSSLMRCVDHTEQACYVVSGKILIYSWLNTKDILPDKSARHLQIYEERKRRYPPHAVRDYLAEVIHSLKGCPDGPEARAHKNYWHQELEVLLSGLKQGD